ncbi:MAG TPA: STAS domain-containing protein [Pseudonocardiaceae bacterium]|jgi:anti-anti-sigma factor|nr:STAS domain-containing protein [Pseudonocardiaceae bacterium]
MTHVIDHGEQGRAAPFDVVVSQESGRTAVYLRGELDASTAPRLESLLDQLRHDGHHQIALDLFQLAFLGAAGLRVLVRTHHALHATGGTLLLTRPARMVHRILAITGLDAVLIIQ